MVVVHIPAFWFGFFSFPVIALIVLSLTGFGFRQVKAIKTWFIGVAFMQWWAMWMVVLGIKVLRKREYCRFMHYSGRYWLSPTVKGFEVPKEDETL